MSKESATREFTRKYCDKSVGEGSLTVSDIDNICHNYRTGKYVIIEHKSRNNFRLFGYNDSTSFSQSQIYKILNDGLSHDPNFLGVYSVYSDEYDMCKAKEYRINGQPATRDEVVSLHNTRTTRKPIDFTRLSSYEFVTLNKTKTLNLDDFETNNND